MVSSATVLALADGLIFRLSDGLQYHLRVFVERRKNSCGANSQRQTDEDDHRAFDLQFRAVGTKSPPEGVGKREYAYPNSLKARKAFCLLYVCESVANK